MMKTLSITTTHSFFFCYKPLTILKKSFSEKFTNYVSDIFINRLLPFFIAYSHPISEIGLTAV